MSRIYRDIMEEVVKQLEDSDLDKKTISMLKNRWYEQLHNRITNYNKLEENQVIEEENSYSDSEEESIKGRNTKNFMICLYDKVTKNKHKFRTLLKQGFINIGPEDYAFSTGTGDLDW
ncbi:RNA polymerase II transcription initiation factor TFIIA, large chain [Pseudoloma neurophilia]|uniref:RNA polymerase II transcription initiation factor TFIIA, large chain n=1 Tax=Pseudoloma neurophilia TaxID=146866 RepID=A0A0R0LUL4_9MICR|nr:RNA polymerase II transcription initiation factor TFIIA, large chain [Pseudoloma neurophilia]